MMYETMLDVVIPKYRDFNGKLEAISLTLRTEEVRALHELYIEAANIQYSAMLTILNALEQQDFSIMSQATESMDEGRRLLREFQGALQQLASENDVELSGY